MDLSSRPHIINGFREELRRSMVDPEETSRVEAERAAKEAKRKQEAHAFNDHFELLAKHLTLDGVCEVVGEISRYIKIYQSEWVDAGILEKNPGQRAFCRLTYTLHNGLNRVTDILVDLRLQSSVDPSVNYDLEGFIRVGESAITVDDGPDEPHLANADDILLLAECYTTLVNALVV